MAVQNASLFPSPKFKTLQTGNIQILEGANLERYLTGFTEEDRRQARELWRKYAPLPDLIDFGANDPTRRASGRRLFGYDGGVYFERFPNGSERKIPDSSIRLYVDKFSMEIQKLQRQLMTDMLNGVLSPQDWYNESIRLMKLSYLAIVMIAQGESNEFDDQEESRWLLLILLFFLLHNELVKGIISGRIPLNGKLPIYAGLRGSQIVTIYEDFRYHEMIDEGKTEARRRLAIAEHCEPSDEKYGCVQLSDRGWMPIHNMIPIGDSRVTCGKFCKCRIEYR